MSWLTLAEAREFLQIPDDDPHNSVLLQLVLDGTCQAIEEYIRRPVVAKELTTYSDGGTESVFLTPTVFALSSVVENGAHLTEADYALYPEQGILRRRTGCRPGRWASGLQAVVVTYTAGVVRPGEEVPANIRIAGLIAAKFYLKSGPEDWGTRLGDGVMIRPERFPRQALWLLDPYRVV